MIFLYVILSGAILPSWLAMMEELRSRRISEGITSLEITRDPSTPQTGVRWGGLRFAPLRMTCWKGAVA